MQANGKSEIKTKLRLINLQITIWESNYIVFETRIKWDKMHQKTTPNEISEESSIALLGWMKYYYVNVHWDDLSVDLLVLMLTFATPGQLLWQDNSALDFVNWDDGEPSGDELAFCGELSAATGNWSILPCSSQKGFICKKPKSKWLL